MGIQDSIKKFLINIFDEYDSIVSKESNWVYVSYLSETYRLEGLKLYMKTHQNKQESLIIRDVFNELNYNFKAIRYDNRNINLKKISKNKCDIIFGIEPGFGVLCDNNLSSKKIYYATGSYFKHQNNMIIKRTDEVNRKKNSNIPYYRLVENHNSVEKSDYIIQIGSRYTIETYPEEYRDKIILINQTSCERIDLNIEEKIKEYSRDEYLWFGGKGSILKGLDLVLDYFHKQPNYKLHIVGPVDEEFKKVYKEELFNYKNIIYHGYLAVDSEELNKIANKCSFVILPSGSEGGLPGSVINMMKLGLIPIVSKYAACNYVKEKGFIIKELSEEGIDEIINKSQNLSNSQIESLFVENNKFIKHNYNKKVFKSQLKEALKNILY